MNILYLIAGLISAALLLYLSVALLRPETFE
jgi:K+-transporting ATPase KdpF subunit